MKLVDIPEQITTTDIDEEILEIFVEEVEEVSAEIVSSFKSWKIDASDVEALKTLRRAFHTLKGSGRLVGAAGIGELGWCFENMLNRIIDGAMPRNDLVLKLLAQVEGILPKMVQEFQNSLPLSYPAHLLISQTTHLTNTKGQSIGEFEAESIESNADASAKEALPAVTESLVTNADNPSASVQINHADDALPEQPGPVASDEIMMDDDGLLQEMDSMALSDSDLSDLEMEYNDLSTIDDLDISEFELTNDNELLDNSGELLNETLNMDNLIQDTDILSAPDSTGDHEMVADSLLAESGTSTSSLPADHLPYDTTVMDEDESLEQELLKIFRGEAQEQLELLQQFLNKYDQGSDAPIPVSQEMVRSFHTLTGSSRSVGLDNISELTAPLERYTRTLCDQQQGLSAEIHQLILETIHTVDVMTQGKPPAETEIAALQNRINNLPELPSVAAQHKDQISSASSASEESAIIHDASDEFMVIFLEEAEEILENTQSLLERWQSAPQNMTLMKELQRELHTLKGGARMVGIMPMGNLGHKLESVLTRIVEGGAQSNPRLQEIVQRSVDELASMLECVRNGLPLRSPAQLLVQIDEMTDEGRSTPAKSSVAPEPSPSIASSAEADPAVPDSTNNAQQENPVTGGSQERMLDREDDSSEDRIRVRVTLIDRLTNLIGELSISRAHFEQQQGSLKGNLSEMEQTVLRLRDQLRRLEIETEAQIISHFGDIVSDDEEEEFDPLEMDRFSDMQQLSRSLMESISDLGNIQDQIKTLSRQNDSLIIQQARIGNDLQDCIMRTRMIPFSRISPRLQRIARLTARELHKKIDFTINDESIEFERTVLNRLVAPLEHMLRNAIGHGIEEATIRHQRGKDPIAHIVIDLFKEGTELVVKLSDDGGGLNLAAIRLKAEERGMITRDAVILDEELMQFILEPSFSTAEKITQVSGRGVGMDVVNSEIKQLGGTLKISSQANVGTVFDIRLPLSLTINQALMIYVGEDTMAVPLTNVDAVMRAPREEVLADDDGHSNDPIHYTYRATGNAYQVMYLNDLLGLPHGPGIEQALVPTLLVHTSERRIALLVDGIEGSREIVVKSVGPQISAIRWIAGATILGDGRVVLIMDIPALIRTEISAARTETMAKSTPRTVIEEKVQDKPQVRTIMVVDDSITVRKVTARLLKRQGMEVLTAKDGVDAFAQLQEHIPDLMLLDIEMPRMDGYELATQVRNSPHLKDIPIIMITSRTGTKHRDRAEKIGINRYLGKPFNETELLENINLLLSEDTAKEVAPA